MKTYPEAEKYFQDQINDSKENLGNLYKNQGDFYNYCSVNTLNFQINRPPQIENSPTPLKWESAEDFYTFFGTIPKGIDSSKLAQNAEDAYTKALALLTSDEKSQAEIYLALIDIYDQLSKYDEQTNAAKKSREIYTALGDKKGLADVTIKNALKERFRTYDMDKALKYFWEAHGLYEQLENKIGMANCLIKIADVYHPQSLMKADIVLWEKYNNQALDIMVTIGERQGIYDMLNAMLEYYDEVGNKDKIDFYSEKAKNLLGTK